jgi:hypothetical protein
MCVIANKAEAAPLDPVVIARHYLLVDAGRVQTAPGAGRNQALIAIYEIGGIQAIAHAYGRLDCERHSVYKQVAILDNPVHEIVVAGGSIGTNRSGGHILRIGHHNNTPWSRSLGQGSSSGGETYRTRTGGHPHEPTARELRKPVLPRGKMTKPLVCRKDFMGKLSPHS